jgi:hypothetical protein
MIMAADSIGVCPVVHRPTSLLSAGSSMSFERAWALIYVER